jgi:hypothetical protein
MDVKCGYVYIIGDNNAQKIGHTFGTPQNRLRTIQTCCPKKLGIILAFSSENPVETELNLHKRFSDKRLIGEWFSLSENELDDLISEFGSNGIKLDYEGDFYNQNSIGAGQKVCQFRKIIQHTCPVCGASFTALKTAVYCSNACRQKAKYQRGKKSK